MSKTDKNLLVLDPESRYEKLDETLSIHSNVICFKAYDRETGLEVSWYEIDCRHINEEQKAALESRANQTVKLRFKSMLSVLKYWFDNSREVFYLITESVNSRSILDFMSGENSSLQPGTIQKWARNVLAALNFLHCQPQPIIHSRVDLASIFIKSISKDVKLMPPLLNPYLLKTETHILKLRYTTPPEALFNRITTASDIWSFGIAVLYGITMEQPYSECSNADELIKKLSKYQPPQSLEKITEPNVRSLIMQCLQAPETRKTAMQLLQHPFFMVSYDK